MTKALLFFSIGPVQPFIEQARKASDLWMGSLLLSELMHAGLVDYKPDGIYASKLLYPDLSNEIQPPRTIADLPNKFVAEHDSLEEAQQAAESVISHIKIYWQNLADNVWVKWFAEYRDQTLETIWNRQVEFESLFESYWAATEWAENEPYGAAFGRGQRLLDARKRLRNFPCADEPSEKSVISGEREALHRAKDSVPRRDQAARNFWEEMAERIAREKDTPTGLLKRKNTERLDAVDTVRRFATQLGNFAYTAFPSVDTTATKSFIDAVIKEIGPDTASDLAKKARVWAEWAYEVYPRDFTRKNEAKEDLDLVSLLQHCDGKGLRWQNLTPRRILDRTGPVKGDPTEEQKRQARAKAEEGRKALDEFLKQVPSELGRPPSYYALLIMDGDNMGHLISSQEDKAHHQNLSKKLSEFARGVEGDEGIQRVHGVQEIVEKKHHGRVVYAGGDDVMAFLPLSDALDAAQELRAEYQTTLRDITTNATASASITIAHCLTPLKLVLKAAREAEEAAKERYGRNALVVALLRRSGSATIVGAHWSGDAPSQDNREDTGIVSVVTAMRNALDDRKQAKLFSRRFIFELLEEAPMLQAIEDRAQHAEIKRLLLRHCQKSGIAADEEAEKKVDQLVETWANRLVALAQRLDNLDDTGDQKKAKHNEVYEFTEEGPRAGLMELCGWLLVADFLARGGEND